MIFTCLLNWTVPSYALKPIEAQESKGVLAELLDQFRQVAHAAGFPVAPAATPQRSVRPLEKSGGQTLAAALRADGPIGPGAGMEENRQIQEVVDEVWEEVEHGRVDTVIRGKVTLTGDELTKENIEAEAMKLQEAGWMRLRYQEKRAVLLPPVPASAGLEEQWVSRDSVETALAYLQSLLELGVKFVQLGDAQWGPNDADLERALREFQGPTGSLFYMRKQLTNVQVFSLTPEAFGRRLLTSALQLERDGLLERISGLGNGWTIRFGTGETAPQVSSSDLPGLWAALEQFAAPFYSLYIYANQEAVVLESSGGSAAGLEEGWRTLERAGDVKSLVREGSLLRKSAGTPEHKVQRIVGNTVHTVVVKGAGQGEAEEFSKRVLWKEGYEVQPPTSGLEERVEIRPDTDLNQLLQVGGILIPADGRGRYAIAGLDDPNYVDTTYLPNDLPHSFDRRLLVGFRYLAPSVSGQAPTPVDWKGSVLRHLESYEQVAGQFSSQIDEKAQRLPRTLPTVKSSLSKPDLYPGDVLGLLRKIVSIIERDGRNLEPAVWKALMTPISLAIEAMPPDPPARLEEDEKRSHTLFVATLGRGVASLEHTRYAIAKTEQVDGRKRFQLFNIDTGANVPEEATGVLYVGGSEDPKVHLTLFLSGKQEEQTVPAGDERVVQVIESFAGRLLEHFEQIKTQRTLPEADEARARSNADRILGQIIVRSTPAAGLEEGLAKLKGSKKLLTLRDGRELLQGVLPGVGMVLSVVDPKRPDWMIPIDLSTPQLDGTSLYDLATDPIELPDGRIMVGRVLIGEEPDLAFVELDTGKVTPIMGLRNPNHLTLLPNGQVMVVKRTSLHFYDPDRAEFLPEKKIDGVDNYKLPPTVSGDGKFAVVHERAGDRRINLATGESLPTAGLEEVAQYFDVIEGSDSQGPRVLFAFPPGQKVIEAYKDRAGKLFVLKSEHEPSGSLDKEQFLRLVREIDPEYLSSFVNDAIDARVLDESVTPSLIGINHMGLGFGNIDLKAAAARGIQVSYVGGGEDNVLRRATAGMAAALTLVGWFDLVHQIKFSPTEVKTDRSLSKRLGNYLKGHEGRWQVVNDFLWAQFSRQRRRLDEGIQLAFEDRFRGAGNGEQTTVRGHQLGVDPNLGIQTTLGILSGRQDFTRRWAALAKTHQIGDEALRIHQVFYSGKKLSAGFEGQLNLTHVESAEELARQSDYVIRTVRAKSIPESVIEELNAARDYDWLVDPKRLALKEDLSVSEFEAILAHPIGEQTIGFLGLGSIGSAAAQFLKLFGAKGLIGVMHDPKKQAYYDELSERLGITYVELDDLFRQSDIIILTLPDTAETRGILSPERLELLSADGRPKLLVNVGRGTVVGETLADERAFGQFLLAHPNVRYATDVTFDEGLPLAEQPLLDEALRDQVLVSSHMASNAGDPSGHSVREDGMGMIMFANYEAMRDGKPLPNPVPMPTAGLEETSQAAPATTVVSPTQLPQMLRSALRRDFTPSTKQLWQVHIFDPENADLGRLVAELVTEPVVIIARDEEHAERIRQSGFVKDEWEDRLIVNLEEYGNDIERARVAAASRFAPMFDPQYYRVDDREKLLLWLVGIMERYDIPDSALSQRQAERLLKALAVLRAA